MANHITELNVSSFRGIKNLALKNLSDINIIVGENNSGKTSLLEAIQLFCDPTEFGLIKASRQRDVFILPPVSRMPTVDSLMYLFDFTGDAKNQAIQLDGILENQPITIKVLGRIEQEFVSIDDFDDNIFEKNTYEEFQNQEIETFVGTLSINNKIKTIRLNSFSVIRTLKDTGILKPVEMLTPFEHTRTNSIREITDSKDIILEAIRLLQKFDPKITDIRYKEYYSKSARSKLVPVLEVNEKILVPLSAYGDGMKKCLVLLNKLLMAENGVLLIDEFETALHTSLMQEVFHFLITVAQELNIQLFMTTHSLEAVDKLLEASQEHLDKVRVIRLANREDKTYAGIIDGHKAYKSRTVYGMELRG